MDKENTNPNIKYHGSGKNRQEKSIKFKSIYCIKEWGNYTVQKTIMNNVKEVAFLTLGSK